MASEPLPITCEDAARLPRPLSAVPNSVQFSPDDRLVTFLQSSEGSLAQHLFGYDIAKGDRNQLVFPEGAGDTEESLSLEEKLRRERTRNMGIGVTSYMWSQSGTNTMRVIVPLQGALYAQDFAIDTPIEGKGSLRCIVQAGPHPILDPRPSPRGTSIAFVRDGEIYVAPASGCGAANQITSGARGTPKTHGLAEYIAMEEMDRQQGYWWSSDESHIAFTEVDESHIPVYRIVHQGSNDVGENAQEDHRYPFAGAANAVVRLAVVRLSDNAVTWMELTPLAGDDFYLARVHWLSDNSLLAACLNRHQTKLQLLRFDIATGKGSVVLTEESDVWVNLYPDNMFSELTAQGKKDGSDGETNGEAAAGAIAFLWTSERTGFRHLYVVKVANGSAETRQITGGDWQVDKVVGVDRTKNLVYFLATIALPTECHLYSASLLDGPAQQPTRITQAAGMHDCVMDSKCTRFVDSHSTLSSPPSLRLYSLSDPREPMATLHFTKGESEAAKSLGLTVPEIVTVKAENGDLLYGAIYRPPADQYGRGPFPTCVNVYGGPHAQRVTNSWGVTVDMRAQLQASQGILVFKLDNRGSARRGVAFEAHIKHNMGDVEVRDQCAGVKYLVQQNLCDPSRVGIYGWSYGGYMALMGLARAADVFTAAVAGAPVTHWDGYDTCYTERYMGLPQENAPGYEVSSVMAHAGKLYGDLLIVHGLLDENVHFRHTARLLNTLNRERKAYDLLLFPDERHSPRSLADRTYMEERIHRFFLKSFGMLERGMGSGMKNENIGQ